MDDVVYYNELYDIYKELLTDKQRMYFEDYYFNNYSFSEMADRYDISRNGVFRQVHIVTNKLREYDNKLNLYSKKKRILNIIDSCSDEDINKELEDIIYE